LLSAGRREPPAAYLTTLTFSTVTSAPPVIYLMLLSNGVNAIGLVSIERWRELLRRARNTGRFLGVDEQEFPRDFASFVRYYTDLKKHVPARDSPIEPLSMQEFERLWLEIAPPERVRWQREAA